jgi:hypothetical protein
MPIIVIRAEYAPLINLFRSNEETRYYLNGFYAKAHAIQGVEMVATDGHRLGCFRDEEGHAEGEPAIWGLDKPTLAACKAVNRNDCGLTRWLVIMPPAVEGGAHALAIVLCPARDELDKRPNWERAAAEAALSKTDTTVHTSIIRPIDGTYPDYQRVVPHVFPEKSVTAWFNASYLDDFGKVAATCGKSRAVAVYSGSDNGPAVVMTGRADFFGVLMPVRGTDHVSLPYWWNERAPEANAAE